MNTTKASVKIQLYKSKVYANGKHPVVLLYRINGKVKKRVLAQVLPTEWDVKTNRVKTKVSNSAYLNSYISDEIADAEREILALKRGKISTDDLLNKSEDVTVQDCINNELDRLKREGKVPTYVRFEILSRQLQDETPTRLLDKKWMDKLVAKLKNLGNGNTTIQLKIENIRSALNKHAGHLLSKEIEDYSVKKDKTIKQKLTEEELNKLIELDLSSNKAYQVARDIFVLSVYLRGIRIGDIMEARVEQFENGRFKYSASKTGKIYDIKLIPQANQIVDLYREKKSPLERLFPVFEWEYDPKKTEFQNKADWLKHKLNKTGNIAYGLRRIADLAGIKKKLSPHISRHTFSKMAIGKIKNPMITMELLGHSSLAVHQAYLEDIQQDDVMDQAADDIFSTKE